MRLRQVYYHLGELDSALTFALGAGNLFDVHARGEFVEPVVGMCGGADLCALEGTAPAHPNSDDGT